MMFRRNVVLRFMLPDARLAVTKGYPFMRHHAKERSIRVLPITDLGGVEAN